MELGVRFTKSILLNVLIVLAIILIILVPRDLQMMQSGYKLEQEYSFSVSEYYENISRFFTGVMESGSLGITKYKNPVEVELARYMPRSLKIIVSAFFLALFFGIFKGVFDFMSRNNKKGMIGNGITWAFQSIPDFFLILCLQWIILFYIPIIKLFGHEHWFSFVVPSILVSLYPMMYVARVTVASLANEEGKMYIQVARAKGFSHWKVLYKHILRNSLATIFSHFSSLMVYILSNLLIVEYLLDYKGAAYRLFQAMGYNTEIRMAGGHFFESELIIGIALCFMVIVLVAQIISQFARTRIDPR